MAMQHGGNGTGRRRFVALLSAVGLVVGLSVASIFTVQVISPAPAVALDNGLARTPPTPPPAQAPNPATVIVPGAAWSDQNGNLAQLHGVGMLKVGQTYYAFGEDKTTGGTFTAVACYSSTDLVSWQRQVNSLSLQASGDLGPNRVVERPKVIYNATTRQYVMYMHIDSTNYADARVGVATSPTPCGPYTYLGSSRPLGQLSRDIGLYQDTDGTAYLLSEDRDNGLRIYKLAPDYLSVESAVAVLPDYESPAMVKVADTYYLFGSQLTGWNTNDNLYASATSLAGPWSAWKTFAPVGTNTFNSQTSYILPVTGRHGTTYLYIGDRWYPSHLYDSAPIWLPITIGNGTASLPWQPAWSLDIPDGTWAPQTRDTSYEAEASTNTLSGGAQLVACSNCSGGMSVGSLGKGTPAYSYDDVDPALHYTGSWTHAANLSWTGGDFDNTESFSTTAGDALTVGFTGTAVRWIGPTNTNGGIADVYVDGAQVGTVDTYAAAGKAFQQILFADTGLTAGAHTLKIVVTGQKNAASSADTVAIDAIDLHVANDAPVGAMQFNHITVPRPGDYTVKITYLNWDAANRVGYLSVNGATPIKLAFPTTGGTNSTNIAVATIHLDAGQPGNTLLFSNDTAAAPEIDKISVPDPVR